MNQQKIHPEKGKKRSNLYTVFFIGVCAIILIVLMKAPPETTKKLPYDEIHQKFYPMGKKEAEKFCPSCHDQDKIAPLPKDHPPKYRCLFCHKKDKPH